MAYIDLQKLAGILGSGGSPLQAIGVAFGMPQCLIEMAKNVMGLLPSSILSDMANDIADGKAMAHNVIANIMKATLGQLGIGTFNTETGQFDFFSDSSKNMLDSEGKEFMKGLGGFFNALSFGSTLFNNYQVLADMLGDIKGCLEKYKNLKAAQKGTKSLAESLGSQYGFLGAENILAGGRCTIDSENNTTQVLCVAAGGEWIETFVPEPGDGTGGGDPAADALIQYAIEQSRIENALVFIQKCDDQLKVIGEILLERQHDPSLEPVFLIKGGGTCTLPTGVASQYTTREDCEDNDGVWVEYTEGAPAAFFEGTNLLAMTKAEYDQQYTTTSADYCDVFDLVYGPPISKEGQFVLTIDGLYYDSQSGGVPEILGFVPPAEFYKFEQPANLGGKGQIITNADMNLFVSSIFDINTVDNSNSIKDFYDNDHFLQTLIGERNKHINKLNLDLSAYSLAGSSLALLENTRQEIYSQVALHNNKIDRRKKQIEVAVKASTLYGSTSSFTPGTIPINDFTYLKDLNIVPTLEQQKNIIFTQADICDVVLPLHPKFVKAQAAQSAFVANHLLVPTIGKGSIIYDGATSGVGTTTGASGTGTLYSLTDGIVTDKLFAIYNFLEGIAEPPSSTKFAVMNCASELSLYGNAQLIADNVSSVYVSGLSIPRLKGLVKYKSNGTVNGVGSAVRLPDINEFNDLFYKPEGCSLEFWVHVPGIETSSTSNVEPAGEWGPLTLNRLILGCENIGGDLAISDNNKIPYIDGTETVKGFIMGFTRDQQITRNGVATSAISDVSNPLSGVGFFMAPTVSYNGSSIGFINKSISEDCVVDVNDYYKMFVSGNYELSSRSFNDVSSNFCHICTTISPSSNEITVYLDGIAMATSSISEVFGEQIYSPVKLPTFYRSNSFEYNSDTIKGPNFAGMANVNLATGPSLNSFFTPYILGGGYTDGILKDDMTSGFMGALHGKKSGLNGFIGSAKFYSKTLNKGEVLKNYKAQKGYFKNIKT